LINYAGLYTNLKPIAVGVVSRSVSGVDLFEIREIAHDITSDFLLCSKSFKSTFDKRKGSLEAFFSSYVRKKCYSIREKLSKERRTVVGISEGIKNEKTVKDSFVDWEEMMSQICCYKEILSGQIAYNIDLGILLGKLLFCVLEEGRVINSKIAKELGVSRESVRLALKAMRQKLSLYR